MRFDTFSILLSVGVFVCVQGCGDSSTESSESFAPAPIDEGFIGGESLEDPEGNPPQTPGDDQTVPVAPGGPDEGEESVVPEDSNPDDDDFNFPDLNEGEGCFGVSVDELSSCCGGTSHCVPVEAVTSGLAEMMSPCDGGSVCIPDNMIGSVDTYSPINCVSIGGTPGACVSQCVPDVQAFLDLLPTEGCWSGDICAPCIDPLSGEDTGACKTISCPASSGSEEPDIPDEPVVEPEEYSCENPPAGPVVDVSIFNPCFEGAHCVPTALVPADFQDMLSPCDGGTGLCVPDELVAYAGFFTPLTCTLPGGVDGRCLSTALPDVAAEMDLAPQLTCAAHELCIPCCDPFSGEDTGACSIGCDTGPEGGICEAAYSTCCDGIGTCVPAELVPSDDAESLNSKGCDSGFLCAPDALTDPMYIPPSCEGEIILLGAYSGVCLPKCIDIPMDFLIWSGTCASNEDCVPCEDPLTGSATDAPGCP